MALCRKLLYSEHARTSGLVPNMAFPVLAVRLGGAEVLFGFQRRLTTRGFLAAGATLDDDAAAALGFLDIWIAADNATSFEGPPEASLPRLEGVSVDAVVRPGTRGYALITRREPLQALRSRRHVVRVVLIVPLEVDLFDGWDTQVLLVHAVSAGVRLG